MVSDTVHNNYKDQHKILGPELMNVAKFAEKYMGTELTWQQLDYLNGNRGIGKTYAAFVWTLEKITDKPPSEQRERYVFLSMTLRMSEMKCRQLTQMVDDIDFSDHDNAEFLRERDIDFHKTRIDFSGLNREILFRTLVPRPPDAFHGIRGAKIPYTFFDIDLQVKISERFRGKQ